LHLVFLARLAGIVWSLAGAWLVYCWTRELFGSRAGVFALLLWCMEPNVLAHAHLMTPDMPCTVAGLAACYFFWRYLRAPSWRLACFAGIFLGVAQLTKFTTLLLYGAWFVLWLLFGPGRRRAQEAVLIFSLSLFVLNLGYGFKRTGWPLGG